MENNNNANIIPAHILWVELSTRITSQKLHYRSGNEETAAESIHKLFERTRELMIQHPNALEFNDLSLKLINTTLRTYTARWHRWMTASKLVAGKDDKTILVFRDEQVRRLFRSELIELQDKIKCFIQGYEALKNGKSVDPKTITAIDKFAISGNKANLGSDLIAGITQSRAKQNDNEEQQSIEQINTHEQQEILKRRKQLNNALPEAPLTNATAIALSGGGIRSATFCLGIVQTLAKKNLFHQFDYLSTVSGGGYLGTFISSSLADVDADRDKSPKQVIDEVLTTSAISRESIAIRHLRNSSKYLGTGGIQSFAGQFIYGVFTSLLLLLPLPLIAVAMAYFGYEKGFWAMPADASPLWLGIKASWAGKLFSLSLAILLFMVFLLPLVQSITRGNHQSGFRKFWQNSAIKAGIGSMVIGVIYFIPSIIGCYSTGTSQKDALWHISLTAALPLLLSYGAKILAAWKKVQDIVLKLFIASGPLFFIVVFLVAGSGLGIGTGQASISPFWYMIITLSITAWGWWWVNINEISPHRFYRDRLCSCYLIEREKDAVKPRISLPLSQLFQGSLAAPYHLINTTVNLTISQNPELRGRNGDFFVFSKHFCGSRLTGYESTHDIEDRDPHIDLGTAMAISGAAASTGMGWQSRPNFRFLMGLLNIRLGYWLLNPKKTIRGQTFKGPGPTYLFKEIAGKMNEDDKYLNLSDGGHIENLAVYELLKRKCKYIVCIDAGCEPGMECADLMRLQRYAEIDLGIRMEYDISDLRLDENGLSRAYAALVKILYPATAGNQDELGWMLYLKLAVTGVEPGYVWDYRKSNPTFPHQTTADQFFDEAQFEAYRMLGECAAESLFRSEMAGRKAPDTMENWTVENWFQVLANNLLADNDEVFKK